MQLTSSAALKTSLAGTRAAKSAGNEMKSSSSDCPAALTRPSNVSSIRHQTRARCCCCCMLLQGDLQATQDVGMV